MPKKVTVAANNRYCQARLRAAEYNNKFYSRSGAAEEIPGVTEDSLKKYELGTVKPPNDVVALMADTYNEPELVNWYCANECPLGINIREIELVEPERTAMRLFNACDDIQNSVQKLFDILDDGIVEQSELPDIASIKDVFIESKRRLDEVLAMIKKIENGGKNETI